MNEWIGFYHLFYENYDYFLSTSKYDVARFYADTQAVARTRQLT